MANLPILPFGPCPRRPSIPAKLPLDILFIISLDSLNCLIKRLTSANDLAEPFAIRLRLLCERSSGFSRSAGVIESTIAFMWATSLGSPCTLRKQWYQRRVCLLYTSPSPRDRQKSRMPSSA
eukprot:TRINITY_DN40927_c0_g1_i1.p3 TRINITY_DN40927_c0_g1~~TRINITY_DN40927_c0_g1_i1.p3  ORF type:complete len:122 (+),score=6.93 TRINITY_DN40927_c0_g1_i1:270-635(+)